MKSMIAGLAAVIAVCAVVGLGLGMWMAQKSVEKSVEALPVSTVVALETKTVEGRPIVIRTTTAELRVWRRTDGTCYVSVAVQGWETFFVDASGPPCATGQEPSVTLKEKQ